MYFRCLLTTLLTSFLLISGSNTSAQKALPVRARSIANPSHFLPLNDSSSKVSFTTLAQAKQAKTNPEAGRSLATCNTTTFYMHLPAPAGQKINIKEVQTLPGGDFVAFGNISLPNNEEEGLVIRMNNGGIIVAQKRIRIKNKPSTIFSAKISLAGTLVISGIVYGGTNDVFVSELKDDLSTNWVNIYSMTTPPLKIAMDLVQIDYNQIIVAVQLTASIAYASLSSSGNILWAKEVAVTDLTDIVGFNMISWGKVGLVANCIINGKRATELLDIELTAGTLISSHILSNGPIESMALKTRSYNANLKILSIAKNSATSFKLVRDIVYNSIATETRHTYTINSTLDFNVTGAMDNASDALGFCLPQDGKMIFIRHFAYYQIAPEYTREYAVPVGSSIAAIARSLDGGYIFGLNSKDSKEIIFIKTDSIGVLPGCGFKDVQNDYIEEINQPNHPISTSTVDKSFNTSAATMTTASTLLSSGFDCNQNYCPPAPIEDTCLSTYFKIYKSNSYADPFGSYHLMRNNNQLAVTVRYDRFLGGLNQLTYGIKLFDERGHFIKGVKVFVNGVTTNILTKKMDDHSIMLVAYTTKDGIPYFTLTLVNDNLEIIWTKSVKTYVAYEFMSDGFSDVVKDEEGNYYMVASGGGIWYDKPKVQVYKIDSNGNQAWLKTYALDRGNISISSAVTTKTSLIMICEGWNEGSVTVRLDKNTGAMLNGYIYKNSWAGSIYSRLLEYQNGRIYYGGSNGKDEFTMALFDTTGKPLKLKIIDNSSIIRGGTIKNGSFYATYYYFNGTENKEVVLKADSNLNIQYLNEYDYKIACNPVGLEVSEEGNIYVAGNHSYGGVNGSYYDPYIKKYNSKGELGSCSYISSTHSTTDLDPQPVSIGFSPLDRSFEAADIPVTFVPDDMGQQIAGILCSSASQCSSIKVSGTTSICKLNQEYTYKATTNALCNLSPIWSYDTAFASIKKTTDTTISLAFKRTGDTWLKARLNTGCSYYSDSVLLHIQQASASFSLGNDTTICPGDSVTINAGSGFNSYKWNNGSATSSIKIKTPGKFYVRVDNVCNDVYSDTIIIGSVIIPPLSIGGDTLLCSGDTLLRTASSGFKNYTWLPNPVQANNQAATAIFTPIQNSSVIVKAITVEGCHAADSMNVTIIAAPVIKLGADTSICANDSVIINAGNAYTQYRWNTGSSAQRITLKTAGNYSIVAKAANGCYAYDTLVIQQVYKISQVNLGSDFDVCMGEVKRLDAGTFASYKWQDGSAGQYYNAANKGVYSVLVKDNNNCLTTDTILLKDVQPLPANFLKAVDSLCQYDKLNVIPQGSFKNYLWSTGSALPALKVDQPGVYRLSVTDANGCTGSASIRIVSKSCMYGVYIPTAFTPNTDGFNDVFRAKVFGNVLSFQLTIYNRFGEVVFSTNDRYKGWDGNLNGIPQNQGAFVYTCTYHLEGGKPTSEKGTIVLIR